MDTTPQVKASRIELRMVVDMIEAALIATLAAPERDSTSRDLRQESHQKRDQILPGGL
jgi:hypothetical protein